MIILVPKIAAIFSACLKCIKLQGNRSPAGEFAGGSVNYAANPRHILFLPFIGQGSSFVRLRYSIEGQSLFSGDINII